MIRINVSLSDAQAQAILRSEGFSNGWGIGKSKALQSGEEKLMDAIQTQWNELCERRAAQ